MATPKLVYIEWFDSFGCSSVWTEINESVPEKLICKSVGWLHHDGEDYKLIIPHVTQEEHSQSFNQGCGDMAIPTKSIIKICQLEIR